MFLVELTEEEMETVRQALREFGKTIIADKKAANEYSYEWFTRKYRQVEVLYSKFKR